MVNLIRLKFLLLASALAVGVVLASCANPPNQTDTLAPAVAIQNDASIISSDQLLPYLTINVDINDAGIQPASIYLPVGQSVLLVMRNRGDHEHHFHISELLPTDMLWLSKEGVVGDIDTAEHAEHNHGGDMVPYHICSPESGIICPSGAVHAHAEAGDMDVILFTPTNAGTFVAKDPLHPEIVGQVIVY